MALVKPILIMIPILQIQNYDTKLTHLGLVMNIQHIKQWTYSTGDWWIPLTKGQ